MEIDEVIPGSASGEEDILPSAFNRDQFHAKLARVVDEEIEDLETAQIIDLLEALPGNYSAEMETQEILPEVRDPLVSSSTY
jgi:transposase